MRADMLGPDCDRLWIAYLAAEREGLPSERDVAMSAFVEAAQRQPLAAVAAFAAAWCAANLDGIHWAGHGRGAPVRLSLVLEIVGPAVWHGRAQRVPVRARWLAGLWTLLIRDEVWRARLEGLDGPRALLDEALALDPADDRSRELRCRDLMASIAYALHELPWIIEDEARLRANLERLAALSPLRGQAPRAFAEYIAAVQAILDGDRTDNAIDRYSEAEQRLKEGA